MTLVLTFILLVLQRISIEMHTVLYTLSIQRVLYIRVQQCFPMVMSANPPFYAYSDLNHLPYCYYRSSR